LLWASRVVDGIVPTTDLFGPPPGAGLGPHIAVNLHGRGPHSHRLLATAGPRRIIAYACPPFTADGPRWDEGEHEVRRWTRLVCGDTGVAHLATALGTPSVLLFGPVPPSRWGPLADPELHTV